MSNREAMVVDFGTKVGMIILSAISIQLQVVGTEAEMAMPVSGLIADIHFSALSGRSVPLHAFVLMVDQRRVVN
jgi:hypothetical protein